MSKWIVGHFTLEGHDPEDGVGIWWDTDWEENEDIHSMDADLPEVLDIAHKALSILDAIVATADMPAATREVVTDFLDDHRKPSAPHTEPIDFSGHGLSKDFSEALTAALKGITDRLEALE
jgi:hypothetical protein